MRTAISVSVTIFMLSCLTFNSISTSHRIIEQSFFSTHNEELIAKKNPTNPKRPNKGTPYRGSGRREFM